MDVNTIKTDILKMVDRNWEQTGRPLLLSTLGSQLGPRRLEIEAITGLKLKGFVTINLKDDLQILAHPNDANIIGLVPKEAELASDVSYYFQRQAPPPGALPRYKPSFWAAFAKPIAPNNSRFIRASDLIFVDQPQTAPPPEGMLPIGREYIPPEEMVGRHAAIVLSIDKWLGEHPLDRGSLLLRKAVPESPIHADERNLLEMVISVFDEAELKRLSIPLDLAAKLARVRVR